MRLVPHDRHRAAGILRAQPPEERGKLAVGREILHRDHVPSVVDRGKDLRRLNGAEERARREDVDRRHNRPQPRRAAPHLPAPIIRKGTLRVVLSGARELLLLLGDGMTNDEYLHVTLLCDGSVG
jgi:hypothetical protein